MPQLGALSRITLLFNDMIMNCDGELVNSLMMCNLLCDETRTDSYNISNMLMYFNIYFPSFNWNDRSTITERLYKHQHFVLQNISRFRF